MANGSRLRPKERIVPLLPTVMTPAFLTWLFASRKANQRIRKQYDSNLPAGIV